MFKKPGEKLKTLAEFIFGILAVVVVIVGYILFLSSGGGIKRGSVEIILGIVGIVIGIFLAWCLSIGLYAFGELVEDTHAIRKAVAPPKKEEEVVRPYQLTEEYLATQNKDKDN